MDFSQALAELKLGNQVFRRGWNGNGLYLFLAKSEWLEGSLDGQLAEFIAIHSTDENEKVYPWLPSQRDLFSTDWQLKDE